MKFSMSLKLKAASSKSLSRSCFTVRHMHSMKKPHQIRRYWREALLICFILGSLIATVVVHPIGQSPEYHNFADKRVFWGIPNFFDVTTNIFFMAFGLMGLIFCLKHREKSAPWSWRVLFLGVILVSFGSGYYHWSPDNRTLVWDRLPITMGFTGLFAGLVSEHVNQKFEKIFLVPAVLLGFLSVMYWHYCDDLRFYIWVQCMPLICIPVVLALFKGKYTHRSYLIIALALYGLAKLAEIYDKEFFDLTRQQFSGHSLKHLLAALGPFSLYMMLKHRRGSKTSSVPVPPDTKTPGPPFRDVPGFL